MKYFTDPNGKFVIEIPSEWQYKNVLIGEEEVSPFSFQLYDNPIGAFQISCYSHQEKTPNKNIKIQKADTNNLEFVKSSMDDKEFNMKLWYAQVEDHMFMAKYIYEPSKENDPQVKKELEKVEFALSTLELLSPAHREVAIAYDKYEKFMASLAASFDLKHKAIENASLIEFLIITANQIDAYLRMALVMKRQLKDKTNFIDIALLYQGENDPPIAERKIYRQALEQNIIDQGIYDKLEELYKERNKVVHRYIISEFKTRNLYQIVIEYENIYEQVRLSLKAIENLQFKEGIGIHGNGRDPEKEPSEIDITMLYSQINDKHLVNNLYRPIKS